MKFCNYCGKELFDNAVICPGCGCAVANNNVNNVDLQASPKSRLVALLLCIFFSYLGIHRFYVGKAGTGILWLLTVGLFGIGSFVDLIMIICGSFTDKEGKFVKNWND